MDKAGFQRAKPNITGWPSYDPRDLLKLYVYGYKLTTDPEARVMQSKDGFHCYYNVRTTVDKGSHLIAEYEVANNCTDQGLLKEVADKTREMLEVETLEIVADKGYESRRDIESCVMNHSPLLF